MSTWDDPEFAAGGEYVEFTNVGDSISGTVNVVRTQVFEDGKKAPQILLTTDDGTERTLTAGQTLLRIKLVELRPEAGDHLRVTLTQIEKRQGGKTLKHFDVVVTRGNGVPQGPPPSFAQTPAPVVAQPVAPAPVAPPIVPAVAVDPQVAAAALAALSPEQRAALGLS